MQTVQQQRAAFALRKVKDVPLSEREAFKSQAESFPAMIRMNGLGQAAAFYFSKREQKRTNAHERLYALLSEWMTGEGQPYHACGGDLLHGITGQNMDHYRLAQAESLLLLDWVKKFAKAFQEEASP